jgi:hypothetical protein
MMKAALVAVVSVLVLADVAFAGVLVAHRATTTEAPVAAQESQKTQGQHPCNHGFYVSQAAHAKKGGGYVSGVAQGKLGKDGNCSAKLPAK